ncbi:unnamed protein product [Closterium sp. Naga37s-1]|nr:unnamed protein product [Closterium sp. Naga37s-1]
MALIRAASLRAARSASKPNYLIFGTAFDFEALAIPLCTAGGPLPGRHCSVLLVVRHGDLLLPDKEQIGTFYCHLDPKTSSKLHEEEAANVLRFFGEAVKSELNREGRKWTAKAPSAEVLSARLESLAAPIRDKLPDILWQEVAGMGLLAVNSFAWSLDHLDDVHRSYDPLIVENPKLVGVKALRLELVHHMEKAALNTWEAASTVGRGVGTGIALGGEAEEAAAGSHSGGHGPIDGGKEEHEREDKEGGGEQDGGSDEEEEDEEREDDDVMVLGEEEAVQFAGEKVADKSGGSGPKTGKKARGSGGSTTTKMASKAAIDRLKAVERENKKLREEKLVAEKKLEFQTARMDTLFGVVTSALNKLTTVADRVTSHEPPKGGGRYEGGRAGGDALGEKIKTVVSAEVKAAMESEAQGIAAAVTAKDVQELRDDLVKAVDNVLQDPSSVVGKTGGQPMGDQQAQASTDLPSAHDAPPNGDQANLADDFLGGSSVVGKQGRQPLADQHPHPEASPATAQGARPSGGTAQMADELLHLAKVVGQPRGEPVAGQHVQPSTTTATARPTGVTAQLADDLLRPATVVGQQGGQPGAGQHLHPSTSTATAQAARPGGVTAFLVDELLRPAAVAGQHVEQAGAGQHPHTATSPATAQDARPGGVTAFLVDKLLRPAALVGQHVEQAGAGQHPHTATAGSAATRSPGQYPLWSALLPSPTQSPMWQP